MPERNSLLERSAPLVRAFTRYRRALGMDEVVEGARPSRIGVHFFRGRFSKRAGEALLRGELGFSERIVAEVAALGTEGKALGATMAVCPGRADDATRRACVASTRL